MSKIYAEEVARNIMAAKEPEEDWVHMEPDMEQGYVVIKYETSMLREVMLLDGMVSMMLPDILTPMEEEFIQIKYPDADRPECIYSDEEGEAALTMTFEEGSMEEGELEEVTELLSGEMKRLYPSSKIEGKEMISEQTSWFSLDIPLMDDTCCHMMFFHQLSTGLIMGTFDCSTDSKKRWKGIVKQLLGTIKEIEQPLKKENSDGSSTG